MVGVLINSLCNSSTIWVTVRLVHSLFLSTRLNPMFFIISISWVSSLSTLLLTVFRPRISASLQLLSIDIRNSKSSDSSHQSSLIILCTKGDLLTFFLWLLLLWLLVTTVLSIEDDTLSIGPSSLTVEMIWESWSSSDTTGSLFCSESPCISLFTSMESAVAQCGSPSIFLTPASCCIRFSNS